MFASLPRFHRLLAIVFDGRPVVCRNLFKLFVVCIPPEE